MRNEVANVCKKSAIILGILGVPISFIVASNVRHATNDWQYLINLIICFVSVFLSSLIIYAIGEVIQILYDINLQIYDRRNNDHSANK